MTHVLADILKPAVKKLEKPVNILILRHTFGSLLIRAGFNYVEVSTITGNSPEICRRHYARLEQPEGDRGPQNGPQAEFTLTGTKTSAQ